MPNEKVCACGVATDLSKSRNSSILMGKLTILLPKTKGSKSEGNGSRKPLDDERVSNSRASNETETGSSSTVAESTKSTQKKSKHEKRLTHSRRTRSADRAESHYTYIDSDSSVFSGSSRESSVQEVLYATIPDIPIETANETGTSRPNSQDRSQPVYTAIPSMTSPPPTYDVAVAKTLQTGRPPTYEEYYEMMSRSHSPPPPWNDLRTIKVSLPHNDLHAKREMEIIRQSISQLPLSERLARMQYLMRYQQLYEQRLEQRRQSTRAMREPQIIVQRRPRAMPPRSQSESRAQQQRIAAMYTDAAFCMETTVLQTALDSGQGFALCSLM